MIRGLELLVSGPDLGRERGGRSSSISTGPRFSESHLCKEAAMKTQRTRLRERPVRWTLGAWRTRAGLGSSEHLLHVAVPAL